MVKSCETLENCSTRGEKKIGGLFLFFSSAKPTGVKYKLIKLLEEVWDS